VYRIGFLSNVNPTLGAPSLDAFRQGLRELGWVEGQNVAIDYRWADGNLDRLPALAADLVQAPVDVILTSGPGVRAALQATSTVPIVGAIMADPVVAGFASSLARPAGSVTGSAVQFEDLVTKQLETLKETVPKVAQVAILTHHTSLVRSRIILKAAEAAARALGLKGRVFEIRDVSDLEGRPEMPVLERLHREFASRGLAIIGINAREDRQAAGRYATELGLTFPLVLDQDGKNNHLYGVIGIPTTFVIARDGRPVAFGVGPRDWASRPARALIEALLAEPAPRVP
jgi:thiol-disulfide isomerase/thioredoxin